MGKKLTGILSLVKPKSGEPAGVAEETIALAKDAPALAKDAPSEEVVTTKDTPGEEVDDAQEDTPADEVKAAKESLAEEGITAKDAPAEEVVTTAVEEPPVPETCESPRIVEAVKVEPSSSDVSTSMGKKTLAAIISFAKRKNTTSEPGGATAVPSTKDASVAGGQDATTVAEESDPPATEGAKAELSTSEGTSVRKSLTAILNLTKRKSTVSEPAGTVDAPGKDVPAEEAAATVGSEAPVAETTGTPVVEGAKNESSASDGTSTSMGKRFAGILNLKKRRSSSFSESADVAEPSTKDAPVEEVVAAVAEVTSATTEEGPKDDPPVSDIATPKAGKRLTLSDILHLTRRKNNSTSEAAADTISKDDSAEGAVVKDTTAAGTASKDAPVEVAVVQAGSAEEAISKHVQAEEAVTSSSSEAPATEAAPTPIVEAVKSEPSSPGMGKRLTDILHIKRRKNNSISEPADAPAIIAEEAATAIGGEAPPVAETAATPVEGVKSEPSSPSMGKRLTGILHLGRRKNNSISEPADAPVMDALAEEATTPSEGNAPAEGETPSVTGVSDGTKQEPSSSSDATSMGKRLTGILNLARRKNNSSSEAAGTSDSPSKDAPAEEVVSTAGVETPAIEASSTPVVEAVKQEPSSSDGTSMGKRLTGILSLTRRKNNSTSEPPELPDKTAQAKEVVTTDASEALVAEEPATMAVEVAKSEPSSSDSISMGKRLTGILSLSKRRSSSMSEAADAAADAKDGPLEETVTTATVETPVAEGAATTETKSDTKGKRFAGILNLMKPKSSPNKGTAETTVKDSVVEEVAGAVVGAAAAADVPVTEGPKVVPASTDAAVLESEEVEPLSEVDKEAPVEASGETLEVTTPATEVVAIKESETTTGPEAQSDAIAGSESAAADTLESVIAAVTPLAGAVAEDETDAAIKIESPEEPAKVAEPVEAEPKLEAGLVKVEAVATSPEKTTKEVAPEKLHKRNKSLTLFNMFVKQETAKTEPVFEATKDDTELAPIEAPKQRTRSSMSFLGCLSKPKAIEA